MTCQAHTLTVLAVSAVAATTVVTPPAFGEHEPELHNQAPRLIVQAEVHAGTDLACPAVTPSPPAAVSPLITAGGCRQHYTATNVVRTAHLSAGGTEVVTTTCNLEFDLRLDTAGEGYITHQELTPGTQGACTVRVCGQVTPPTSEGRAWIFYTQETEVAGQGPRETAIVLMCLENADGTNPGHCEYNLPMSQVGTHRYQFGATDVPGHGALFPHCEFTGTATQEAVLGTTGEGQLEQNVEIRHT